MCSSGLEALSYPLSTKFFKSTDLRFTTKPAIATYTLLQAGVLLFVTIFSVVSVIALA